MSARSFSGLGVPDVVVASLAERGITEAFPIQELAIPPGLDGLDVCGKAPTGSGKTLAFGIPLAQRVQRAKARRPRALVLAPTRELAAQIHDELVPLLRPRKRSVASFYGGVGFGPQLAALKRGVDVAVACPGRLADLIDRGAMRLDAVEFVVIDEADRMADMGFLPEVKRLLDQVREDRQTLLFSATLDGDVDVLIRRYQTDPERCEIEVDDDHADLTTHSFVRTEPHDRIARCAELVEGHGSTIVFCRTKHGADRVARQLKNQGVSAVPIHGGRSQGQRTRALAAFSDGKAKALVATDVAARGIHVDYVGCVVHYDVAGDHKDYVHRSGRTGRAGAEGVVVTFVTDRDAKKARQLRRALDIEIAEVDSPVPTRPDSDTRKRSGGASQSEGKQRSNGTDRSKSRNGSGGKNRSNGRSGSKNKNRSGGKGRSNGKPASKSRNGSGGKPGSKNKNRSGGKNRSNGKPGSKAGNGSNGRRRSSSRSGSKGSGRQRVSA